MSNPILAGIDKFFNTLDHKLEKNVQVHLKKVYSCLALSLLAAAVGAYVHVFTNIVRGNILCSFGAIIVLLLLYATPGENGQNEKLRLGYLLGFSFLSGLSTGPLLDYAISVDPTIISTAFFGTCIVFGCFTAAAVFAPDRKFLYLGGTLLSLLSTMFWMAIFNLFVGSRFLFQLNLYAGLAIMCAFILYDTQLVIEKSRMGDGDYIRHSVDLFIDFLDIFRRLVILLSQKEVMLSLTLAVNNLKSWVPGAVLLGASVPYYVGVMTWYVASRMLPRHWYAAVDDAMYSSYQRLMLFSLENMSGVRLAVYGDANEEILSKDKSVICISNHQSTMDWAVADMLAIRQGSLGHLRYMLKSDLQYMPLYGFYFYMHGCVYVRRNEKFNQRITSRELEYLANLEQPSWLVVFPEGTRYNPKKPRVIEESRQHAEKLNVKPLRHVLMPRARGLQLALAHLRHRLDAIYDLTIFYSQSIDRVSQQRKKAPTMFDLVTGPPDVALHVHLKRIPIDDVPTDGLELRQWLYERFAEKDELLDRFYANSELPSEGSFPQLKNADDCLSIWQTLPSFLVLAVGGLSCFLRTPSGRRSYVGILCFGTLSGIAWMKLRKGA